MSLRRMFTFVAVTGLALSAVTAFADPLPTSDAANDAIKSAPQVLPVSLNTHAVESPLEPALDGKAAPSIPEPATAILVGIALLGAGTMVRRRKARQA